MVMAVEISSENYNLGDVTLGIELTADHRGLTACRLLPSPVIRPTQSSNTYLREASTALQTYFDTSAPQLDARLAPDGTPFQQNVWHVARSIPFGEVRSYSWIANRIGNPKAVRAVAQALSANPLLLFVPCHRVVRNNGDLGGFACGVDWKQRLLELEGVSEEKKQRLACSTI